MGLLDNLAAGPGRIGRAAGDDQCGAGEDRIPRPQRARRPLQKGGLDEQVKSWLGPGANLPVTAEQLRAVLGNAQVQDFARQLGLPVDQALKTMAQYLPEIVDKASPNGVLKGCAFAHRML